MAAERQQNNASGAVKGKTGKSYLDFTKQKIAVTVAMWQWCISLGCLKFIAAAMKAEH